ncbi:protein translocase subunit SecF [Pseudoxanthomonas broegbernensis]|uniref:Protein-export membrane protein SecF n=1 Tax=Pseudoxanthomonas broegbernensis TaxID=83619 RepID=A0A7V8K870_9GAMM|nr:protein translocase subunit SecF [Pseudoxanthomonas broegbernensis]KAF1687724.1 protein translocase subunit SecF [Pseudoxanthomonas broegbernensis]MBB6064758.1 preprotein translocase subunit SecF [Pseudoxanthomonas broegbernensis]
MKIFPLTLIPHDPRIGFMRMRWVAMAAAALLCVASVAGIAIHGFNYALDFTGGTVVEVRFEHSASVDDVRERVAHAGYEGAQVQNFGSGSDLLVRLQPRDGQTTTDANNRTAQEVMAAVDTPENRATLLRTEFVGPQVGKELAMNGLYAAIFVVVGFLIYIGFRFEFKFAVSATLTTMFDVLVVAGYFAWSGREFDLTVLAGLLSVMGFSINDTIVVFDRVRENFRSLRADPDEVFDRSINQTLSRTIITSVVFFLSVLALYLYGGGSLEGLALSQMIGAVIGTLSSIFIACPLLTLGFLKVTKQDLLPKAKDEAALARRP